MKSIYIGILAFILSSSGFAQSTRSKMLKNIRHIELIGDKLIRSDTVVLQINERMGDHDAQYGTVYQKGDKISFGDIWVEDMSGNVLRKLKKSEIIDRSYLKNSSLYSDMYVKYFEMKHNEYPYKLIYSVKIIENKYTGIESLDFANYKVPVENGELIVSHPLEKNIKSKFKNISSYVCDTTLNTVVHRWKYTHKPELNNQIFSSINNTSSPRIDVAPTDFKFAVIGDNTNWDTFGNWIYRLNAERDKLTATEIEKIERIVSTTNDKKEKIKLLYYYMQDNTRYIYVSTKYGGLQTHPAEYVCTYKYGDCKALSNYMYSMLKHVGIKSFYTLIYSDDNVHDLDDDFSQNAFNHAILAVPLDNDTIFLECTSKNTPPGYVGTHIQGRKALIVEEQGSCLVDVPQMNAREVLCSRMIDVNLLENGQAKVDILTTERGSNYELGVFLKNETNQHTIDKYIRETILEGSYEIESSKILSTSRDSATVNFEVASKMKNIYKQYGNNLVLLPLPMRIPTFETPNKRTLNIQIDYPIYYQDTIRYNLDRFAISKIPENIEISSPFGDKYLLQYEIVDKKLVVYKQVLIAAKRLTLLDYEQFYNFITKARNNEHANIFIETL